MLNWKTVKKGIVLANTGLMLFVAAMMGFYAHFGVTYMVYHSIPTIAIHIVLFFIIWKERMGLYAGLMCANTAVYMVAATICLGYPSGFHLYCTSLILVAFYMEYMARKFHTKTVPALPTSLALICLYLLAAEYSAIQGALYQISPGAIRACRSVNIIVSFVVLVGYSSMLHKIVLNSEDQLFRLAQTDKLTGLYNRHYMITRLDDLTREVVPGEWAAMLDIDDFKNFNDNYGHACGDYVLVELSRIMRQVCSQCVISRWGGEEFLITTNGHAEDPAILEQLRQRIADTRFDFHGQTLAVTVTIGMAYCPEEKSLDSWIQSADRKLYEGKNSGKNRVIY